MYIYRDIQKNASKSAEKKNTPNVCRSRTRTYCCPGWERHKILGLCIKPKTRKSRGYDRDLSETKFRYLSEVMMHGFGELRGVRALMPFHPDNQS
ncbi:hypothetical protein NQ318_013654 [Aromia moschata]|uniref:Fibrillin 1 unique N-terminal domain-containing protein n=1 Tax=Aromia moschata TaxID=1265417 RepID=A0AAV8Y1F6_9CUCU|nr:hypothetical protein NQ318_013654 [Aromia moschata]